MCTHIHEHNHFLISFVVLQIAELLENTEIIELLLDFGGYGSIKKCKEQLKGLLSIAGRHCMYMYMYIFRCLEFSDVWCIPLHIGFRPPK